MKSKRKHFRRRGHWEIGLDFYGCRNVKDLRGGTPGVIKKILQLARESGCTIRKWHMEKYKPHQGYTLMVSIAESHFTVQTWPETKFRRHVNVNIFLCNYTKDNSSITRKLAASLENLFRPSAVRRWKKLRGPK